MNAIGDSIALVAAEKAELGTEPFSGQASRRLARTPGGLAEEWEQSFQWQEERESRR